MAATTAGNPLNRHIDVEAELQRLVRQRLAPPAETGVATSPHRSLRHRRQPLVGAFDSPEGFAFASPRR